MRGGNGSIAAVGACRRSDCTHDASLGCTAPAVEIGTDGDHADCLTYAHAA